MKKNSLVLIAAFFVLLSPIFSQQANSTEKNPAEQNLDEQNSVEQNSEEKDPSKSEWQHFKFKYKKGDSYRILSTVKEKVFVNDEFSHDSEIVNRIAVSVTDKIEESGVHEATFMTSESSTATSGRVFSYGEEYKSVFTRDPQGKYTIGDKYFMPVVRDVPIFPDREIGPGEFWTAQGHEAHDLRRTFALDTPYIIPFNADYEYLGIEEDKNGKTFHKFDAQYTMQFTVEFPASPFLEVPVMTQGFSHQTLYWDASKGCLDHYNEEFKIVIVTSQSNVFRFEGVAEAQVTDFKRTTDEKTIASVKETIENLGIKDVSVSAGEKGLTLSIENIQFAPDSDVLLESEKIKLDKLAQIFNAYPDNDLLITGHTALRGTARSRKILSERRAEAVANYLIQKKVRDKYHIFTQGMGGDDPIADNSTEAGRIKNRRVEITIMDR